MVVKLNKLMESLDDYYKIYKEIISNFDNKKRNYYIIKNLNEMNSYNIDFMNILNTITNEKIIKNKIKNIILMSNKMVFKEEKNDNKIDENNKKEIDNINNSKSISFSTNYNILKIIALHDGRILTYQYYEDDKKKYIYKVFIYNLNYDTVICDISSDTDYSEKMKIIQMDDDNVIKMCHDYIKIYRIKKNFIEEIQTIKIDVEKICKLSNEKILLYKNSYGYNYYKIYLYHNGKLIDSNKNYEKEEEGTQIYDLCAINEDEIVLYCSLKGKIYGENSCLIFFDIKNNKYTKTLKIGDEALDARQCKLSLMNKDFLAVSHKILFVHKFILIDLKNRRIKKEIKYKHKQINNIYLFEEKFILVDRYSKLILYSISDDIKLERSRYLNFKSLAGIYSKDFKDKLILIKDYKKVKIKNFNEIC